MQLSEFAEVLKEMHDESSRLELREMVQQLNEPALRILLGEYEDAGVGPATARSAAEAVFGDVSDAATLEEALIPHSTEEPSRSVGKMEEDLQLIADTSGKELEELLESLYHGYSEPWLLPFALLGDYSTGVSRTTVAKAYFTESSSEDSDSVKRSEERSVNFPDEDHNRVKALNPDLAAVTAGSDEPVTEVTPGQFFEPMLASPKDLPENTSQWVAEPKLDGYRLLVHWDGDEAIAQTRRLNDVTHSLPELAEIDWPDQPLVLDCEVIAEDGTYKSTSERIGSKEFDRTQDMHFAVFDCLYAGQDVTSWNFRDRKTLAEKWCPSDDRVYVMETYEDIATAKEETADIEGIIAKDATGSYKLGKRSMLWRKDKNTPSTVDARIVGFEEGDNRHHGTLGKVRLESANGHDLGWCGSGFTDKQREKVWNDTDEYYGTVVEVKFDDFDDALRFPTFVRFREQGEADSLQKIKELAG